MDDLRRLLEETIALYVSSKADITGIRPLPMKEGAQGWSGAELRRYEVEHDGAVPVPLLTKTMPLVERRVGALLSRAGRDALAAGGFHIPRAEFIDRYRGAGRYVRFK